MTTIQREVYSELFDGLEEIATLLGSPESIPEIEKRKLRCLSIEEATTWEQNNTLRNKKL